MIICLCIAASILGVTLLANAQQADIPNLLSPAPWNQIDQKTKCDSVEGSNLCIEGFIVFSLYADGTFKIGEIPEAITGKFTAQDFFEVTTLAARLAAKDLVTTKSCDSISNLSSVQMTAFILPNQEIRQFYLASSELAQVCYAGSRFEAAALNAGVGALMLKYIGNPIPSATP